MNTELNITNKDKKVNEKTSRFKLFSDSKYSIGKNNVIIKLLLEDIITQKGTNKTNA